MKFIGLHYCTICERAFLTPRNLHSHKMKVHKINNKVVKTSRKGAFKWTNTLLDDLRNCGVPEVYLKNVAYPFFATMTAKVA